MPLTVMTNYIKILQEIIDLNQNAIITIGIMFVNGLTFLVSVSREIKFTTAEYLSKKKQPHLVKSIKKIISLYNKRGFNILTALMDREFEYYLKGVLNDFPEMITGSATTPVTTSLFDILSDEERVLMGEEQARSFHHSVAQLPFTSSRTQTCITPMVAFLTMSIKSPGEDDWIKLKRLLKYLRGTIHMPLILKAD
jgi:hypothetical protein